MQIEPYLFFEGCCEEALEFYKKTLGAEVTFLMRFKECPEPESCQPGTEEKVMHANVRIGESNIMVSDGRCGGTPGFQGFALSFSPPNEAEAATVFGALSEGGQVVMPLEKTFWSPFFGMVTDRFGVLWMINVIAAE